MFDKGIKGFLKDKIVILVTHLLHFALEGSHLVVLDGGKVRASGSPSDVVEELGGDFEKYIENA